MMLHIVINLTTHIKNYQPLQKEKEKEPLEVKTDQQKKKEEICLS